jgi:intracellular sulfur oxidation DsrE/DsrF family protein
MQCIYIFINDRVVQINLLSYFEFLITKMSLMKKLFSLTGVLLMLTCTALKAQNNEVDKIHQVIMQLNTADTSAWSGVIGNIRNMQKIWPGKVKIQVVVHGKALDFLVAAKSHLIQDINIAANKGVVFTACENTMQKYQITKEMLIPIATTVPSGIAEIVLKQENGWSYLKAGL